MINSTSLSRRVFLAGTAGGVLTAGQSVTAQTGTSPGGFANIKALVFDTFGTVVDWRASISAQVAEFGKRKGVQIDGLKFADAWRAGYQPAMNSVRTGQRPWTNLDGLHRIILDDVVRQFGLAARLTDAELTTLSRSWHYLKPWSDSVSGLTRLKKKRSETGRSAHGVCRSAN